MRRFLAAALVASLALALAVTALVLQSSGGRAQGPVELGGDSVPDGNSATSLGSRDACVSVDAGDTFQFDIVVSDVDDLVAWELYLRFDPAIIEVVDDNDGDQHEEGTVGLPGDNECSDTVDNDADTNIDALDPDCTYGPAVDEDPVDSIDNDGDTLIDEDPVAADTGLFLGSNPQSRLLEKWEPISDGEYFLGAADRSLIGASGSGVLARLTLQAKADGLSQMQIFSYDFDRDNEMDKGPRLTASGGVPIGDVTGDGVFDDPHDALIAVGESCPVTTPIPPLPPSPTPQPGGGAAPSDTSPPPPADALPVPGDPTFEPALDTPPPTDDGPGSESGEDSTAEDEPGGPSEAGPDDEEVEGAATDGNGEEDGSAVAALAGERTPVPPESGDDSAPAPAGGSSTSSSSDGGFPLWAVISIAAAGLIAASGVSVYLAARAGDRFWR